MDVSENDEEIADLKKVRGKVFKKRKPTDHFDAKKLKETNQMYLDGFREDLSLKLVEVQRPPRAIKSNLESRFDLADRS